MSAVHTFSPDQNPAPSSLAEVDLPEGYVGTGEGEHLIGLYADLVAKGVSLAHMPLAQPLPKAYFPAEGLYFANAKRVAHLLEASGFSALTFEESAFGSWWDFTASLPMQQNPECGLYLLRLMLRFGEDFDQMVSSLNAIFELEHANESGELPSIEAIVRFQRLMHESMLDDGVVFSISDAWQAAKVWEYSEVRKLLTSSEDIDYFLRLAMVGCKTFEEALEVSKTMRKDWVYSLTGDMSTSSLQSR